VAYATSIKYGLVYVRPNRKDILDLMVLTGFEQLDRLTLGNTDFKITNCFKFKSIGRAAFLGIFIELIRINRYQLLARKVHWIVYNFQCGDL